MKANLIDHLFFFVTNRCNGNCKFCFNWDAIKQNNPVLSVNEIGLISKNVGKLKTISISGGEPFLREDFVDICKNFYSNTRFKFISIPTNGLLTETISEGMQEIAAYCRNSFIIVELPLDGIGSDYDQIRGVEGAFLRMCGTFSSLSKIARRYSNLHLKFNITYSYYNKRCIDDVIAKARSIFAEDFDFSLGLIHGNPRYSEAKNVEVQDYFRVLNRVGGDCNTGSFRNYIIKVMRKVANKEFELRLLNKKQYVKCRAGERFVVLSYDGKVYPCQPLADICFGDLREFDYKLGKILSKENPLYFSSKMPDRNRCICDWSCGISRSLWSSNFIPKMLFQLNSDAINFIKNKFSLGSI